MPVTMYIKNINKKFKLNRFNVREQNEGFDFKNGFI